MLKQELKIVLALAKNLTAILKNKSGLVRPLFSCLVLFDLFNFFQG